MTNQKVHACWSWSFLTINAWGPCQSQWDSRTKTSDTSEDACVISYTKKLSYGRSICGLLGLEGKLNPPKPKKYP